MKIKAYIDINEIELEVFKVQTSLFGQPAVLIYNEDRTILYEETNLEAIKHIKKLIGQNTIKTYVAGSMNSDGKIVLTKVLPNDTIKSIKW